MAPSDQRDRPPRRKRDLLYDHCIKEKPIGESFTLRELEDFGVIEDAEELRQVCQELMEYHLFAMVNRSTYMTRRKEDAVKIAGLPQESLMLYNQIESSHTNGIWRRTLMDKTRLHESIITKGIKELISKALVKEIKLPKYPAKRVYMLAHLEPASHESGGSFFSDGEMDVGMVEVIGSIIVNEIEKAGWVDPEETASMRKSLKRKRRTESVGEESRDAELRHAIPKSKSSRTLEPQTADYDSYLSAADLLERIYAYGILKNSIRLGKGDVQQLLDQLEYDGRIQRMGFSTSTTPMYRSVRRSRDFAINTSDQDASGNIIRDLDDALSHTPCGVCPVFKNCEPGGVVSPETCEYMDAWLAF